MRIISYNVNGIRSAISKGFNDWLETHPADVICLQEVKALESDLDLEAFKALGYQPYFFSAQKKGYSGVAILSRPQPDQVLYGNGNTQSDAEGRILRADYGAVTLINAYFPSGSSGDERQAYKYIWLDEFFDYLNALRRERPNLIVCGDYNICHREIDIHSPKTNKDSSGFLPEERAWMDRYFESGFVDSFRHLHPDQAHQYSWWSFRAGARKNNKGWRIDYISVSTPLQEALKEAAIYPDVQHSDHCPVFAALNLKTQKTIVPAPVSQKKASGKKPVK
ncbi:MAG: exodeoxyribonuclease III [Bacteroidetes bacterium]|nr:exodeoxyribonuclease III [Bacteroidota bacterium]MBS1630756.1 exodeoxyribonuclease III [Bacteroidota bacterium]